MNRRISLLQIRFSAQPAVSAFRAPAKPSATDQPLTQTTPDQLSIRFGNQSKPDYSAQVSEIVKQLADTLADISNNDDRRLATAGWNELYKQLIAPLYLDRPDAGYLNALKEAALGRNQKVYLSAAQQELLLAHLKGNQQAIQTALFLHAAKTGDKARLGTLLRKNPGLIHAQSQQYGNTALHEAVGEGKLEMVKYLKEAGANPDIQNKHGSTALHWAAESGKLEMVKYLKEAGANPDIQNKYGDTALIHAAKSGKLEMVKYLVEEAKANPDIQNKYGNTALHWAAKSGKTEVENYLKEAQAKLDIKTEDGDKPDTGAQTPEEKPQKKR